MNFEDHGMGLCCGLNLEVYRSVSGSLRYRLSILSICVLGQGQFWIGKQELRSILGPLGENLTNSYDIILYDLI